MTLQATSYKLQANQGFTLIELIIYLAIVSVLATSLILWALTVGDLGGRARAAAELNASGRFALEVIARDIAEAGAVIAPASAVPSSDLVLTNALGETVAIGVSNNQLTRTVAGGEPLLLTAPPVEAADFTAALATGPWAARNSLAMTLTLRVLPAPARTFVATVNLWR